MNILIKSFEVELSKIIIRKKYWVLLIIQLLLFMGIMTYYSLFNSLSATTGADFIAYGILSVVTNIITPLMAFMLSADLFPLEFENNSIKNIFLRPISRMKIFISKILAIVTYLFANLFIIGFVLSILNLVGGHSGSLNIFMSYLISILPIMVFAAMGSLIALIVSNSSLSMLLNLVVYIAMIALRFYNTVLGATLFTSHLNFYKIILSRPADSINSIVMFTGWFLFMSVLGLLIFEKKEV